MSPSNESAERSAGYAPYAQLVKMLLPSAGSVALYDAAAQLLWCSDGFERPELRDLLEHQRASDTLASRGRVDHTVGGVPVFIAGLRAADARPLGSIVIELGGASSRGNPSMVISMLRPVLDCLEARLDLEHTALVTDHRAEIDLLLSVDENGHEDASALNGLLQHCVRQLGCEVGALLVPDRNVDIVCGAEAAGSSTQLLDRTQKHLLAWVQLNNRPMIVNRGAGGAPAPYKILSCPVRDAAQRVMGLVALFRAAGAEDFEARDARILDFVARKAVAILASDCDELTGLANRAIFERRAERMLGQAATVPTALLFVDIDDVAAINATFGFAAGDEVIQRVADIVRRAAGAGALVSRIGGDRFAVVLGGRSPEDARETAATIAAATSQLGYVQGSEALPVTVGIGVVAVLPGERVAHLLAAGELACRQAKREGAGRCHLLARDPRGTSAAAEQRLAAAPLEEALRSNGFELEAQPIVALGARAAAAVGYELLIRLRGAQGELIAAERFLTACERYGLVPAVDRWVLCAAVELLRERAAALAASGQFVAINVSGQSIESRKYGSFALETLAAAGIPASVVCFEIKEAVAVGNIVAAEAFIRQVTNAGARVALDDFGAGLSSLAHLKRLPVHYLKIDGRFVRRMAADRIAESIVAAIVGAARTLEIATIAEHVESAEAAERLCALGVQFAQGFQFGRPAAFADVLEPLVAASPLARRTGGV